MSQMIHIYIHCEKNYSKFFEKKKYVISRKKSVKKHYLQK